MREARIILPVVDGGLDVLNSCMTELAEAFGGFTLLTGVGGWIKDGEVVEDDNAIFDIACDENKDWTFDRLLQIATKHANLLKQDAVYIRYPDGCVEIVDLTGVQAPHHTRGDCKSEPDPVHVADDGTGQAIGATLDRDQVMDAAMEVTPRYPKVGDIWRNRRGDTVGVVELHDSGPLGGLFKCRTLRGRGPTHYVTFDGVAAGIQGRSCDLVDYVTSF